MRRLSGQARAIVILDHYKIHIFQSTHLRSVSTGQIFNNDRSITSRPVGRRFLPFFVILFFDFKLKVCRLLAVFDRRYEPVNLHSPTRSTLFMDISTAAYSLTTHKTYSVKDTDTIDKLFSNKAVKLVTYKHS